MKFKFQGPQIMPFWNMATPIYPWVVSHLKDKAEYLPPRPYGQPAIPKTFTIWPFIEKFAFKDWTIQTTKNEGTTIQIYSYSSWG